MCLGTRAEAEPLIMKGYEGMKSRESTIRSFNKHLLAEAAERVALWRETAGDPDALRRWCAEKCPPIPNRSACDNFTGRSD